MPLTIEVFRGAILKGDLSNIPDTHAVDCTALAKNGSLQPIKKPTVTNLSVKVNSKTVYYYHGRSIEQVVSQSPPAGMEMDVGDVVDFTVVVPL